MRHEEFSMRRGLAVPSQLPTASYQDVQSANETDDISGDLESFLENEESSPIARNEAPVSEPESRPTEVMVNIESEKPENAMTAESDGQTPSVDLPAEIGLLESIPSVKRQKQSEKANMKRMKLKGSDQEILVDTSRLVRYADPDSVGARFSSEDAPKRSAVDYSDF